MNSERIRFNHTPINNLPRWGGDDDWRTGNPPEPGDYVVTLEKKGERVSSFASWINQEWDIWLVRYCYGWTVLAWMPLPEPYKGE